MRRTKIASVTGLWNAVPVVAPALLPVAVLGPPMMRPMLPPHATLFTLLRIDADCDPIPRIPTVVQVIAVSRVVHIHIVVFVPVV